MEICFDSDGGPGGDSGGFLNGPESCSIVQLFLCRIRDGATRGEGQDTGGAEKDSEKRLGNHDESGVVVRLKMDEAEMILFKQAVILSVFIFFTIFQDLSRRRTIDAVIDG
jgi:hypothetical protein